ncbi:DUF3422 domain-containing protein [Croceicoccus mobilis]|uniref:Egg lysin n=1 Tax=Croceicoccus mobilis TaxID=1703339 RepID=A0A916YZM3_9SPHN|nr:DUF3422 domain-containing protein [Croceicoccus mobilis]GGD68890.1 hypothetical protein GCM10010990_18050 [Croceicoccus mobilis]
MLKEHELRQTIVAEMHLRRWPVLEGECAIFQILRQLADDERDAEQAALRDLPAGGAIEESPNPRHLQGTLAEGVTFNWERHSEASVTTIYVWGRAQPALDPTVAPQVRAALDWALGLPGSVVRATRIAIVPDEERALALVPHYHFEPLDLVSCHIGPEATDNNGRQRGPARIWSDFLLREDGFGALLIAANWMHGADLSRTIQRLQELGNYRNMALLGFPVAQAGWKVLDRIETELSQLGERVSHPELTDDRLLEEVTSLSMQLMTETAASDYRMSATEAYATLVEERLEDLCIRPCAGFQSLEDFTQRRFQPAIRTCAAHRRRSALLADRTSQFISLFRSRVETRIENQNGRLLHSMERSIATQLRMQELVEGLSVVALSYYAIGLLGYVLKGIEKYVEGVPHALVLAALVPVCVIAIWYAIHAMKRRVLGH